MFVGLIEVFIQGVVASDLLDICGTGASRDHCFTGFTTLPAKEGYRGTIPG